MSRDSSAIQKVNKLAANLFIQDIGTMSGNVKLICSFCNKTFSSASNCRKHEKKFHNHVHQPAETINIPPTQLFQKYECQICNKEFSSLGNCRRHQKNIHGCIYNKHKCPTCEFSCSNLNEFLKHTSVIHAEATNLPLVRSSPEYSCLFCDEKFSEFVVLVKHKRIHHISKTQSHCSICKKSFNSIKSCKRHERNLHAKFSRKFPCGECKVVFLNKSQLYQHIKDIHSNLIKANEKLTFNSLQDFKIWKAEIEKKTLTSYIRRPNSASCTLYICHRSGYYKSKSNGIRRFKLAGTCKINSYCPASITVRKCQESGVLNVNYYPTHLGYNFDIKHIRLGENEKDREFIKGISVLKHKCEAIKAASNSCKSLPPVASTSSDLKKTTPQRTFPLKKKKCVGKLQANYELADALKNILLSKSETCDVASTQLPSDHTYSENWI